MKKIVIMLLLFWVATRVFAFGEFGQWSSGWGAMGIRIYGRQAKR